jgi:LPXTG-motif cell wall-anchored protein
MKIFYEIAPPSFGAGVGFIASQGGWFTVLGIALIAIVTLVVYFKIKKMYDTE